MNDAIKIFEWGNHNMYINDGIITGLTEYGKSLEVLEIPYGCRIIDECAFAKNELVKNVTVPDTVEEIGNRAFEDCISLEKIQLPQEKINFGLMVFSGCRALKEFLMPHYSNVPWGICSGCTSLKNIRLPNNAVFISGYAFEECSSLEKIIIPDSVTLISESAFNNCINLNEVRVPAIGFAAVGAPWGANDNLQLMIK